VVDATREGRGARLRVSLLLAALAAIALLTAGYVLIRGGRKPVIRLHDGGWDSICVINATAKFIIEEGYGYPVETVPQTSKVMLTSMQTGEIDLNLENWRQNWIDWYNEQIAQGSIVNLGMIFEGGPQFWIVPKWMAEQYNIKTVFDMKEHWELFKDLEDPSKGVFYNGIIGWVCNKINEVKLEAYGLARHYNAVSPGSSAALEAALVRAQRNRNPVFSYYWGPNALMEAYDWHILEEPPYTDECWQQITAAVKDKSLRPLSRSCSYQTVPVDKVAHSDLLEKAPDLVEMLKRMEFGLKPLNKTLAWVKEDDARDWNDAAIYYLRNYEDRWKTWVTPEACERIEKALDAVSR